MRFVGVLLMWAALCSATPAAFAAPWLMVFQLADPPRRVVFPDWTENQELMLAISAAPTEDRRSLGDQAQVPVALYWGPGWKDWRERGVDPQRVDFAAAMQHATFYPATPGSAAVWVFKPGGYSLRNPQRSVGASGIGLLRARGVPTGPVR